MISVKLIIVALSLGNHACVKGGALRGGAPLRGVGRNEVRPRGETSPRLALFMAGSFPQVQRP
jgi:hypothetical protein